MTYQTDRIHYSSSIHKDYCDFDLSPDGSLIYVSAYGNPLIYYPSIHDLREYQVAYMEANHQVISIDISRDGIYGVSTQVEPKRNSIDILLHRLKRMELLTVPLASTLSHHPTYYRLRSQQLIGLGQFSQDSSLMSIMTQLFTQDNKYLYLVNTIGLNDQCSSYDNITTSLILPDIGLTRMVPYRVFPIDQSSIIVKSYHTYGDKFVTKIDRYYQYKNGPKIVPITAVDAEECLFTIDYSGQEVFCLTKDASNYYGLDGYNLDQGCYKLRRRIQLDSRYRICNDSSGVSMTRLGDKIYISHTEYLLIEGSSERLLVIEVVDLTTGQSVTFTYFNPDFAFHKAINTPITKLRASRDGDCIIVMIQSRPNMEIYNNELFLLKRIGK